MDLRDHDYLFRLPKTIPVDRVLVHNQVRPTRQLGMRGFRAWLSHPDPARLDVCPCPWAPELGPHFRVRRVPDRSDPDVATEGEREASNKECGPR
jgi:hypothetical protein